MFCLNVTFKTNTVRITSANASEQVGSLPHCVSEVHALHKLSQMDEGTAMTTRFHIQTHITMEVH